MIAFRCPACEAELEVADSHAGARIKCPDCGHRFVVPSRSRTSARREADPEPRSASRGRSKQRSERFRRDEFRSKNSSNTTALIIAAAAGGTVVCAGLIIGLIALLRPRSDSGNVTNNQPPPVVVQRPSAPINPIPTEVTEKTKPAEESNMPPAGDVEVSSSSADNDQQVYQHLLKSVAWIVNVNAVEMQGGRVQTQGTMGSGSLIDRENRLVLTNDHVVRGNYQNRLVFFPIYRNGKLLAERDAYLQQIERGGDPIRYKVLAQEERCDLALIQLSRLPDGIEPLALAKSSSTPGQTVHSIGGNPVGGGALWIYSFGKVRQVYNFRWRSSDQPPPGGSESRPMGPGRGGYPGRGYGRGYPGGGPPGGDDPSAQTNPGETDHEAMVVETQSPVNHGDSGGPLVNDRGELVAVTQGFMGGEARLVSLFIDVTEATSFIERTCQKNSLVWNRSNRALVVHHAGGVPGLIRNLESKDSKLRGNAAQALGNAGSDARMAIQPLLAMLKNEHDDLTVRLTLQALKKIGTPDSSDLNALKEALNDSRPEVRGYAAGAIGLLGVDGQSAAPDLLRLAHAPEAIVRQNALRSLGKIGPQYKDKVMPLVAEGLKDPDRDVRVAAGEAIASMGSFTRDDIPVLTDILKHQDAQVKAFAATALGKMGSTARKAMPDLADAFKDSTDKTVRRAVVEALANIGKSAQTTVPIYIEALHESDRDLRKAALEAVGKLGADAEGAGAAVGELLSDPDAGTRKIAVRTLKKLGPAAKKAVSALADALKDEDEEFVMECVAALGAIGPDAKTAVTYMIRLFENRNRNESGRVRHDRIAQAIAKIGKDAIKPLLVALEDQNPLVRIGAALSLGEMGTITKAAQRALALHFQADPYSQVREACNIALQKVATGK
jgi:HEAT repeat protein/S1-C subfamily serine protease/DNA-directed RNA polymerase subunit RPC12/RpoP